MKIRRNGPRSIVENNKRLYVQWDLMGAWQSHEHKYLTVWFIVACIIVILFEKAKNTGIGKVRICHLEGRKR